MPANDQPQSNAPLESENVLKHAPYERVLLKAFDKLTSQIFIFCLAYLIILIGLGIFTPALLPQLRTLIFTFPILCVAAYAFIKRRSVRKDAGTRGVSVISGIASRGARVTGVRGQTGSVTGDVKVRSGIASDQASVTGVEYGAAGEGTGEEYLLQLFRQLGDADRRKVVTEASRLLDRRGNRS